jgi:hypothetical protein
MNVAAAHSIQVIRRMRVSAFGVHFPLWVAIYIYRKVINPGRGAGRQAGRQAGGLRCFWQP